VVIWTIGPSGPKKLFAAKQDTKLFDVDAGRILLPRRDEPAGSSRSRAGSGPRRRRTACVLLRREQLFGPDGPIVQITTSAS